MTFVYLLFYLVVLFTGNVEAVTNSVNHALNINLPPLAMFIVGLIIATVIDRIFD